MVLVVAMGVAIWGIGYAMDAPRQARIYMLGLLYVAVLAVKVVLPDPHPLSQALGGTLGEWLVLGGIVALVVAYRRVLARVRTRAAEIETARADPPAAATAPNTFGDDEVRRYARHIALREIGGPGQKRLRAARVLVVGAGGLGAPALLYLGAAGVGTLGIIDDDAVSLPNLQRQVIFRDDDVGTPKVFAAQRALGALNPFVTVRPYHRALTQDIAEDLFGDYDLILDGTDTFAARDLINRAAVAAGRPVVAGAISAWEGQVTVYDPAAGAPCLACVFPKAPAPEQTATCAETGVIGPLPGVIGAIMAAEAVKEITGAGETLRGRMLIWDGLTAEARSVRLSRRADCPVCGGV